VCGLSGLGATLDLYGVLHWAIHAWRLLDQAVFGHAHPCFIWPFGFRGSASKFCQLLIPWNMFSLHGASGECHGRRDLRSSNHGLCLRGDEELARCFVTWSSSMQVGATAQERFKGLSFRVKIQGLALIGCAWQWSCWRHCFESEVLSSGWKPKIYDRAMAVLAHCFLLEGVAFWRAQLLVLSWWC
jgi:hypothetical protein